MQNLNLKSFDGLVYARGREEKEKEIVNGK